MWEAVTRAVASLGPEREAGGKTRGEGGTGAAQAAQMDPEQLVQYEGMLVAASAAQRRRCSPNKLCRRSAQQALSLRCSDL